jgi:hypothetical protein
MPTLTIVTPTRREIHATNVMSLLQAFGGMNSPANKTGYQLSFRTLAGKSNIHHSRSIATSNWYDSASDNDLMLFIDSDHTYSVDDLISAINKFKNTNADVVCGVYSNSAGTRPNIYPKDPQSFMEGKSDEVWYGGTGFMLISKPILTRIKEQLKEEIGVDRVWISDNDGERNVIPFFNSLFSKNELDPNSDLITWLGEDYSFCVRVRRAGGTLRAFVSRTIGHDTSQIKYFFPENYITKTWDSGTLVYYCGNSMVKFSPRSKDLGGSEQAAVEVAKRLKRSGNWKEVYVYGNVYPGVYDGVVYKSFEEFDVNNKFDDIILWRAWGVRSLPQIKANRVFIDLHDNTYPQFLPAELINQKVSKVFVKSQTHANLFPQIPQEKFVIVPNGISVDVFKPTKKDPNREPYRFCWTSSYDRNLAENLEFIWPHIKNAIPEAQLHVYYGDTFIRPELKQRLEPLLKQEGIKHHGRVSLAKIAMERKRSTFHLYVTDTTSEIDCMSVRESTASGCIPLISNKSVFSERDGFHVSADSITDPEQMRRAAEEIVELARDSERVQALREEMLNSPLILNWDQVSSTWIGELERQNA